MSTHTTNAIVQTSKLVALGDAIRAKTGGSSEMTIDEMATAVANIPEDQSDYLMRQFGMVVSATGSITYAYDGLFNNPYVTRIVYGLQSNSLARELRFPNASGAMGSNALNGCMNVLIVDIGSTTSITTQSFRSCSKMQALIIRTSSVCVIDVAVSNAFYGSSFNSDKNGCTLYVPQSLISSYQADSKWSELLALNSNNQILAIEGSPYEL